jgi:hypothetical protein
MKSTPKNKIQAPQNTKFNVVQQTLPTYTANTNKKIHYQ